MPNVTAPVLVNSGNDHSGLEYLFLSSFGVSYVILNLAV